jgi:signal transduction histidine kinase
VSQKPEANKVTASVKDFGMGIPKEEQTKIYERFFRAKGKKEGTIPGLGLGLFISNEIVKQHGGDLWVKSTEGKGSTFYFTLPTKQS